MKDSETIDTHYLKLQGKGNVPEGLEIGKNYKVEASGTITTKTETDNSDGSHSHYWKFEPIIIEIIDDLGKRIRAKDTRSDSQRFRAKLRGIYNLNSQINVEFETWYHFLMENLINYAPEVVEQYQKK